MMLRQPVRPTLTLLAVQIEPTKLLKKHEIPNFIAK